MFANIYTCFPSLSMTGEGRGQWPWLFRRPQQVQGHIPHHWNFIYIPQKLLYLSGWSWFQFFIPALWHIRKPKLPSSHCVVNIWICPLSHQSRRCFKRMQFKWNFLCTLWIRGLYLFTNHYEHFIRNLTLHHFLLSPEVWNIRVSIKLTVTP